MKQRARTMDKAKNLSNSGEYSITITKTMRVQRGFVIERITTKNDEKGRTTGLSIWYVGCQVPQEVWISDGGTLEIQNLN